MLLGILNTGHADVEARHLEYITHVERGFIRLFHGGRQAAATEFEKALKIELDHYEIHHHLGMVYAKIDFGNKAVAAYRRSLELMSDNIQALYSLGQAYLTLGKWAKASEAPQKAIALSPMHARAYYVLGQAQVKLRQFAEAAETLKKAVELRPTSPNIYHELGIAYLNQKKYKEAILYFEKAIQLSPRYSQPHHGLGTAYFRLGEREKARTEMLRFQRLQKESVEYDHFRRLTQTEPGNIEGWARLGELLMRVVSKIDASKKLCRGDTGVSKMY